MSASFPAKEKDPVAQPEVEGLETALADHESATANVHGIKDTAALATQGEVAAKQDAATAATDTELSEEKEAGAAADKAEAKARQEADTAEKTAREAADTTLTGATAAAKAAADAALPKAGGTMTGLLTLAEDPKSDLDAAPRQYVLAQYAALVNGAPEALDTLKEIGDALKAAEESEDSALEALTALVETKLSKAANLSDLADAATARTNLGLGSAATKDAGAAGAAGKVLNADDPTTTDARTPKAHTHAQSEVTGLTAALEGKQPLDSDLTAIAALSTTEFGRSLLALADAASGRTALGLGTAATKASGDFDAVGAAAAAQAASQPLDSDLTAIAALSTTAYGRELLTLANAAAGRTAFGLGSAAVEPASAFQAADSELTALAGLTSAADKLPYFTGSGSASLATLSSFIRTLLDDADAATARGTLGVGSVDNTSDATKNSATATLTNKRITARVTSIESSAEPEIQTDEVDQFNIKALAAAITSMSAKLKGTPTDGQKLIIRILDNGTARAITWGSSFASRGATLPTTTVLSKYLYVGLIYNSTKAVWDCVATSQEA